MKFETILTHEQIERYVGHGYWQNRTITDHLDEAAEKHPEKVALVDSRGRCTYGELKRLVTGAHLGFWTWGSRTTGRGLLPATQLERVDHRPLCREPDRSGQQPAHTDLPRPRGRLADAVCRVQAARRAAGIQAIRPRRDGGASAAGAARSAARPRHGRRAAGGECPPGSSSSRRPGRNGGTRRSCPRFAPTPTRSRCSCSRRGLPVNRRASCTPTTR